MNLEKELLRRSAGLPINESSSSKVSTLDYEADLLRSFSTFLESLERLKERMERPPYSGYGPGPYGAIRNNDKKPDCEKLRMIAKSKLSLVDETIDRVFGKEKSKEYESDLENEE